MPFKSFLFNSLLIIQLLIINYLQVYGQKQSVQIKSLENPYFYSCAEMKNSSFLFQPYNKGYLKPAVTDKDTPPDAYFPVLIVYVQLANDPGPAVDWWPAGNPPSFMNTMIAQTKKYPVNGNWWDTYSCQTELISDYWLEQSRGHFHVIGKEISVILDHDYIYYQTHGGVQGINDDIYRKLNSTGTIDWREFDKWKIVNIPGQMILSYEPDGYVDMIYKVHRSHSPLLGMPAGGMSALGMSEDQGMDFLVDASHRIYIDGDFFYRGSGITLTPGFGGDEFSSDYFRYSPITREGLASFSEHEHGHYLFGSNHVNYGKMSGAGAPYGYDECLSPWEAIHLDYMIPKKVDFTIQDFALGDYSSRNSNDTGEVIEVPVFPPSSNEIFLVASRTKVSDYDRIMWGDTARGDPYRLINPEYGKGVYIYHTPGGYDYYPTYMDQECADGLFNWSFQGYVHPDWSSVQDVEYYARTDVSYGNDLSAGSMLSADGKSIFNFFGIGKKHDCLNCDGTDRIFTNKTDVWTSREFQGDRWDAWNLGYNELFSPYSSPSTKSWVSENTGIFIWYYDNDTAANKAKFKIFKAGYNGMTEETILAQTPPSRPMGLKAEFTDCINGYKYPKIYWLHNMEPDMINNAGNTKSYKIYLAKSANNGVVPVDYVNIAAVNIGNDGLPYFIDYNSPVSCSEPENVVLRYTVTAVDITGWQSVKSDFASLVIYSTIVNNNQNNTKADKYELYQNYPNPFNPFTQINYSILLGGIVKLTVYNVLGEEIIKLVNGYKAAGSYKTEFNGSSLPSGVYFYVLEISGYKSVRKMVLVK